LVTAKPILLHVGLTISIVDEEMPAADQSQVLAADTAADGIGAITTD
jgi:hydrogenase maturation factor